MVKPSLPYLDIISAAATLNGGNLPVACYQVSGEYAMVCAGADKGIYGLREMAMETIGGFVRSGESTCSLGECCSLGEASYGWELDAEVSYLDPFFLMQVRRSSSPTSRPRCWTGWTRRTIRKAPAHASLSRCLHVSFLSFRLLSSLVKETCRGKER
jgi:hypothetical protein